MPHSFDLVQIDVQMQLFKKYQTIIILLFLVVLMIALAFWVSGQIIQHIDEKIIGDSLKK